MIKNFNDYKKKLNDDDTFSFSIESLKEEEINNLKVIVNSWDDNVYMPTLEVLHNRYHIDVPISLVKSLFLKHLDLAEENYHNSIGDTYARELLIDKLLKFINVDKSWPMYSDNNEYVEEFKKDFFEKIKKHGITLISSSNLLESQKKLKIK